MSRHNRIKSIASFRASTGASRLSASLAALVFTVSATGCEPEAIHGYFTVLPKTEKISTVDPSFSDDPVLPPDTGTPVEHGILDGHFDVETSSPKGGSGPYARSPQTDPGTVSYHVHEYDKINKTTTVDFFHMICRSSACKNAGYGPAAGDNANDATGNTITSNGFDQLDRTIDASKRFYLILVNAQINRGGILSVNGEAPVRVFQYPAVVQGVQVGNHIPGGQLQTYTLGDPGPGEKKLTSLKLAFDPTVQARRLLVPTSPEACVKPNRTGPHGEYRDGALIIQAIDADAFTLDPNTHAAAKDNGGLLWEGIVFNHFVEEDGRASKRCFDELKVHLL